MVKINKIDDKNFSFTRTVDGVEATDTLPATCEARTSGNNVLLYNKLGALIVEGYFQGWSVDGASFINASDCAAAINQIVFSKGGSSSEKTQDLISASIEEHNASDSAHEDIRAALTAIKGIGGYLQAYDFGTATPTQQQLTNYALSEIGITNPTEIWNSTRVKNLNDGHLWILNNTPDTDPIIFEWIDDGLDTVNIANNNTLGVVKGSTENLKIVVNTNGEMSVIGLQEALNSKQDKILITEQILTLPLANWSSKTQTVSGLSFPLSTIDYGLPLVTTRVNADAVIQSGIVIIGKTDSSLTFSCATMPTSNVNIAVKFLAGSSAISVNSDNVTNQSTVEGSTVTDVLNKLKAAIDDINSRIV